MMRKRKLQAFAWKMATIDSYTIYRLEGAVLKTTRFSTF